MKSILSIFSTIGIFSTDVLATVALGHGGPTYGNIAWIDGQDVCGFIGTSVFISYDGTNPCGHRFKLKNGHTYEVQGCGGDLYLNEIVNGNAVFNSNCHRLEPATKINCWAAEPDVIHDWNCY